MGDMGASAGPASEVGKLAGSGEGGPGVCIGDESGML